MRQLTLTFIINHAVSGYIVLTSYTVQWVYHLTSYITVHHVLAFMSWFVSHMLSFSCVMQAAVLGGQTALTKWSEKQSQCLQVVGWSMYLHHCYTNTYKRFDFISICFPRFIFFCDSSHRAQGSCAIRDAACDGEQCRTLHGDSQRVRYNMRHSYNQSDIYWWNITIKTTTVQPCLVLSYFISLTMQKTWFTL